MTDVIVPEDRGNVRVRHRTLADGTNVGDIVDVAMLPYAQTDAFARLRVSQPTTLWSAKSIIDNQPLLFDDQTVSGSGGSSYHSPYTASVDIGVTNATAGKRVRQSKQRLPYQPGKSQLSFFTFTLGTAETGITREVGLFDDNNGVFLRQTSSGLSFVVRSNRSQTPDDNEVAQADWNLDAFDGGSGAPVLDATKSQILVIDFEWLGVGTVRCGFVVDGEIIYAHAFHNANVASGVYMSTPNLPVRYSIENDGNGGTATFETICSSVSSEGGSQFVGVNRSIDRATTALTTLDDADMYPLISIRLQTGKTDAFVRVNDISVFTTSTAVYRWALILNPTVAGTALSFSAVANSAVEADVSTTNATKVSGGTVLASGYGESTIQSSIPSTASADIAIGTLINGTSDIVVLAVQRLTGTTESFYATMRYQEQV